MEAVRGKSALVGTRAFAVFHSCSLIKMRTTCFIEDSTQRAICSYDWRDGCMSVVRQAYCVSDAGISAKTRLVAKSLVWWD